MGLKDVNQFELAEQDQIQEFVLRGFHILEQSKELDMLPFFEILGVIDDQGVDLVAIVEQESVERGLVLNESGSQRNGDTELFADRLHEVLGRPGGIGGGKDRGLVELSVARDVSEQRPH